MSGASPFSLPDSPAALRLRCRSGHFTAATSGHAAGYVQANLVMVPADYAFEFLLFCQRNPKPCPLVEVLEAGQFAPATAPEADLRTDLPGYVVARLARMRLGGVDRCSVCTFDASDNLFSYRRSVKDGESDYGRQVAAIALRGD